MLGSMIVVIVVALGGDTEPVARSMSVAAEGALEPGSVVFVRQVDRPPADENVLAVGRSAGADAVAVVRWVDDAHRLARLHVRTESGWVDRDVDFAGDDDAGERGRTLGFAIATMLPSREVPAAPEKPSPDVPLSRPPPPVRAGPSWALDPRGTAAVGVDAPATSFGGYLSGRWAGLTPLEIGASATYREGVLSAAEASMTSVAVGADAAWRGFRPSAALDVGPRFVVGALMHRVARDGSADSRWVPFATVSLESTLALHPRVSVAAAIGAEMAFGPTRIFVDEERVATLAVVRLVAEVGPRITF